MGGEQGIASVVGVIGQNAGLVGAVLVSLLGFLIWRRTKSPHTLWTRLWRLFEGKRECSDPAISNFLDAQSALMQFRFTTGISARTPQQAAKLIRWAADHDEDIAAIAGCGPHFDLETCEVKPTNMLPKRWMRLAAALFVIVGATLTTAATLSLPLSSAVLQMKVSKTWFFLDPDRVKPWGGAPGFELKRCKDGPGSVPATSGFIPTDIQIICTIFKEDDVKKYVETTVYGQRITAAVTALFFALLSYVAFVFVNQVVLAKEMAERLRRRNR